MVRDPAGTVSLDFTGKKSGRGAYICKSSACLLKAERSGRLARNLSCEIPEQIYDAMREELIAHEGN